MSGTGVVSCPICYREHGTALIAAIRAGDTPAALAVLDAHPRAAWIRDDGPTHTPAASAAGGGAAPAAAAGTDSGPAYYPLHLAALAGLGEVVDQLAVQPGGCILFLGWEGVHWLLWQPVGVMIHNIVLSGGIICSSIV